MRASLLMRNLIALAALALAGCTCSPKPPDGNSDAGTPDAGVADAGASDAGELDAGQMDAGFVDGGRSVYAITSGGGTVRAAGSRHSVTLSVGQKTSGVAAGAAHRVELGVLRGTQAK